jgi:hypothetical protein
MSASSGFLLSGIRLASGSEREPARPRYRVNGGSAALAAAAAAEAEANGSARTTITTVANLEGLKCVANADIEGSSVGESNPKRARVQEPGL